MADDSNFPGFEYLLRVGSSLSTAIMGHGDAVNKAWHDIKEGNYGFREMMKTWAETTEGYFQAVVEASRGPGFPRSAAWIFFDCQAKPKVLKGSVKLSRAEPDDPYVTEFASMEGKPGIPATAAACAFADAGHSRLNVRLIPDHVDKDGNPIFHDLRSRRARGQYMGFVLAKGRTSEAPLVIVMLRV